MVNKKKLFEALKEEFEAKAQLKAERRKLDRLVDFKRLDKVAAKEEEKKQKHTQKERENEEHMQAVRMKEIERQEAKENKLKTTVEAKPEIMKLLKKLYEDEEKGFGSQQELYEQARAKNPLTTMQMVKEFFKEQNKDKAPLKDYRTHNSWVGNLPREQYQVDVGYINKGITEDLADGEEGYFMVCIDVFSKRAEVVALKAVSSEETERALRICLDKMDFPTEIYCDQGVEFHGKFKKLCDELRIKIIVTKTYARFAERFIRWVKMQLVRRQGLPGSWTKQVPYLNDKWNSTKNKKNNLTPVEAHQDKHALEVKMAMMLDAKRERSYPELERGDKVRIKQKKKVMDKETTPKWSKEVYTVADISNGSTYHLTEKQMANSATSYKLKNSEGKFVDGYFMRHELLKV